MKYSGVRKAWLCIIIAGAVLYGVSAQALDLDIPTVNPTIAEDIFYFTWAKSRICMDEPDRDVILSFYAYQYRENKQPLQISVNGSILFYNTDEGRGRFLWHSVSVPRKCFHNGINDIIFRSDNPTTNSWAIGVEHVDNPQGSSKSEDRGKNWCHENIGFNYSLVGEYAIRLNNSRGNAVSFEFVPPAEKPQPRVVMTSEVISSVRNSTTDFIEKIVFNVQRLGDGSTFQIRFGSTSDIDDLSWTSWRTVDVDDGKALISPVRLPFFQWRVLRMGGYGGITGQVSVDYETIRNTIPVGTYESYSFSEAFNGDKILDCMRDTHIEMDKKTGGARLRYGEIIKDENGNNVDNIDRSAFEKTDRVTGWRWLGERISDTIWIKKELMLDTPETDRAYLQFFQQIWVHDENVPFHTLYLPEDAPKGWPSPLNVSINGRIPDPGRYTIKPELSWRNCQNDWRLAEIPAHLLKSGLNRIVMHTDSEGDWRFGFESSMSPNRSARSTDGGKTWDYNRLGENGTDNGEYLVRLYLERYHEDGMVWSMPVDLAGNERNGGISRIRDAVVELTVGRNMPPGTEILTEIRFGADLMPDDIWWTEWSFPSPDDKLSVSVPGEGFRYMQWRARLKTSSRLITPVLTDVNVRITGNKEKFADDRNVVIKALENPRFALSSYPMKYNEYGNEKLKMIRERYLLDDVVKDSKDELETLLRLTSWVFNLIPTQRSMRDEFYKRHGMEVTPWLSHWTPNNPVWALDYFTRGYGHMERRYGAFCHDFTQAFLGCCQALGFEARPLVHVRLKPLFPHRSEPFGGHCFSEVWSNQYNKWIYIDAICNTYFLDDQGIPVDVRTIHEASFDPELYKRLSTVRANKDWVPVQMDGKEVQPDVMAAPQGYEMIGIWPRSDYLDKPFPRAIWDGGFWFTWDERLWLQDERVPFSPEFSRHTQRWDDMYYGLNQCFIQPEYHGKGTVRILLSHNMPWFKCYEIRVDGRDDWTEYNGDFLWNLKPGDNSLEVRPVNLYGVSGSFSKLVMTMND